MSASTMPDEWEKEMVELESGDNWTYQIKTIGRQLFEVNHFNIISNIGAR